VSNGAGSTMRRQVTRAMATSGDRDDDPAAPIADSVRPLAVQTARVLAHRSPSSAHIVCWAESGRSAIRRILSGG
jgi:hypothetical protein